MSVRVVRIRYMGMHVSQRGVAMSVAMRTSRHRLMCVIVVAVVVPVRMFVLRRFVLVLVPVRFHEVEHYAGQHERAARRH